MMRSRFALIQLFLGLLASGPLAQQVIAQAAAAPAPAPPATVVAPHQDPPNRLAQIERTYQANLRLRHQPVLQEYIRELEALRQRFTAQRRYDDAKAVDTELLHLRTVSSTSGVLSYASLTAPGGNAAASASPNNLAGSDNNMPEGKPPKPGKPAQALVLSYETATASPKESDPVKRAVPLGTATWQASALPAGTYDIHLLYTGTDWGRDLPLTISYAGQQLSANLRQGQETKSTDQFRIRRIATITLPSSTPADTFTLAVATPSPAKFWVRSVIFSRKDDVNAPPSS